MKISVLTPSFNSAKYVERAILSVLKQDYKNYEHIIMDGGSADGTVDIFKRYPHLRWESRKDAGQSDAMNKAFAASTGNIIIYLNADDELEEGLFSFVVKEFEGTRNLDLLLMNVRMNNQGTVSIRKPAIRLHQILRYWPAKFPLNPVGYAYRRSVQEHVGPFPTGNHYTMDYWFLLRAYLVGNIAKGEFTGGTYYIDGTNKSMDADRAKAHLRVVRNDFLKQYFFKAKVLPFVLLLPAYRIKSLLVRLIKG